MTSGPSVPIIVPAPTIVAGKPKQFASSAPAAGTRTTTLLRAAAIVAASSPLRIRLLLPLLLRHSDENPTTATPALLRCLQVLQLVNANGGLDAQVAAAAARHDAVEPGVPVERDPRRRREGASALHRRVNGGNARELVCRREGPRDQRHPVSHGARAGVPAKVER